MSCNEETGFHEAALSKLNAELNQSQEELLLAQQEVQDIQGSLKTQHNDLKSEFLQTQEKLLLTETKMQEIEQTSMIQHDIIQAPGASTEPFIEKNAKSGTA